ncbi:MAG: hypothetical protein WBX30_33655, partial [Stellaceae bacterium]
MVRIPEPGRFELRLMDGAANPYLMQAGILAGGLDGIARRLDPGKRLDVNMYEPGAAPAGIPRLPLNLLDSLRAFQGSRNGETEKLAGAYAPRGDSLACRTAPNRDALKTSCRGEQLAARGHAASLWG